MTKRRCDNCRAYWRGPDSMDICGYCRLMPPLVLMPVADTISSHVPPVHPASVCMQHQHKGWRCILDLFRR
jgi:hypothetical protein